MAEPHTLYKLIILYMLKKSKFSSHKRTNLKFCTGSGIYDLFYTSGNHSRTSGFRLIHGETEFPKYLPLQHH